MGLEVISRLPEQPNSAPPLLFVHGAWHGAWCWAEFFLPYFAGLGYACHALSLRGHGASPGGLRFASLAGYVADMADIAATLPAPPIVIGHSMGGAVIQKYLETRPAPCAVLLASMPPAGVLATTLRIAAHHPVRFLAANLTMSLYGLVNTPALAREMFFSASMPDDQVRKYAALLRDESYRAFLDMLAFNLPSPHKVNTPVLVLGGAEDTIFHPDEVRATAKAYRTEATILPGIAHDMMLEPKWKDAADLIAGWLAERA
jgi:pimeloyl-ACP methyl ester carboxylesterase